MHVEIETKRLKYELDIKGKYSVIQGDSGNGKTNMCRLLQQRLTDVNINTMHSNLICA